MRVVQVGPSAQKIVPPLTAGVKLADVFSALQPADLDLKSMKRVRRNPLYIERISPSSV